MDKAFLEELGLTVKEADGVVEAELELTSGQTVNPLTRQFLSRANFTVIGDRLIVIAPPELVGIAPINLAHITRASVLEDLLARSLNESIMHVQRRSAELSALGIAPRTDAATLQLSAEVKVGDFAFTISTDRSGAFRVTHATRGGVELSATQSQSFELSEFRERAALEDYLVALFGESPPDRAAAPAPAPAASRGEVATEPAAVAGGEVSPLLFHDIVSAFGLKAAVPARSQVEVLLELKVGDDRYRFAAARVAGKTFRGLIAGSAGKVWADRFEIDDFPGIKPLLSTVIGVPLDQIEVIG